MKLKPGVRLKGLTPQMALAAVVLDGIYRERHVECVITSANDGRHSPTSLHHGLAGKHTDGLCRALDIRTKNYYGDKWQLREDIKEALGDDFDVILEDLDGMNEHLHIEYDPR